MSAHPNVILMAALTPDGLARKTYREILAENGVPEDEDCPEIEIGGDGYSISVMESDYDEGNQISAKEGDIVLHDLVTYGYGEAITLKKLNEQASKLEQWCKSTCENHHCSYEIKFSANYW